MSDGWNGKILNVWLLPTQIAWPVTVCTCPDCRPDLYRPSGITWLSKNDVMVVRITEDRIKEIMGTNYGESHVGTKPI